MAVRTGVVDAIAAFEAETNAKAAVLYCAGRTFVAGADIKEFGKAALEPFLPDVIQKVEDASKPVVAVVHGTALAAVSNSRSAAITVSA